MIRLMRVPWHIAVLCGLLGCAVACSAHASNDSGASPSVSSGASVAGDTAVWDIDPTHAPHSGSRTFTAMVSRLGCSGGKTGHVLTPDVAEDDGKVTVTFSVDKLPEGTYTCQGNLPVPYVVTLRSPLERRMLLDGACLHGEASTTSFCAEGAERWPLGAH